VFYSTRDCILLKLAPAAASKSHLSLMKLEFKPRFAVKILKFQLSPLSGLSLVILLFIAAPEKL